MTPRPAITPRDSRASFRRVKPLRFAPTPFGAIGLDAPSGTPRIGHYVMAGFSRLREQMERRDPMYAPRFTPSIEVTVGRETRLYHAFITNAPVTLDAPATVTLHTAPLADVCGLAVDPIPLTTGRAIKSGRLILVDGTELDWQQARYREGQHLFVPVDPVLVGLNTLQHWLWSRIGSPARALALTAA
jgi:hypothetical protein